jgi:hypothetical protein
MKKLSLAVLVLCVAAGRTVAQEEDYQKWLRSEEEKFQQFKEERDREFTEFLKKEWQGLQLMSGKVADDKPKPAKFPVAKVPPVVSKDTVKTPPVKLPPLPPPEPPKPRVVQAPPPVSAEKNPLLVKVPFYDATVEIRCDDAFKIPVPGKITKEAITAFWAAMSNTNYEDLLTQTRFHRERMRLNDWGYCVLLERIGEGINGGAPNAGTLFAWFMLSKSGYEARVGYADDKVYLMLPARNNLYAIPYFTFSGKGTKRYYAVPVSRQTGQAGTELFTYEGSYEGAEKAMDFGLGQFPQFVEARGTKNLRFIWDGKNVPVPVTYRKDAVEFFEYYPQTNFEVYFSAPVSSELSTSLLSDLRPVVQGRSELEAVNILLRFVQTAFQYKTDQEQFGREKPFFPEETVYYPFSDCEDRSVLFAFLVRNLTGLEVVGLDYPGHIATAVRFPTQVPGESVAYQGKRFVVCDPTYINAGAGMCMPQFKSVTPNVIAFGR